MKANKSAKKEAQGKHVATSSLHHHGHKEGAAPPSNAISNAFTPGTTTNPSEIVQTTDSLFSMKLFNAELDLPIVYSENYNMGLLGIELLHQFDTKKYSKLVDYLNADFFDTPFARAPAEPPAEGELSRRLRYQTPNRPVSLRELAIHHSDEYIGQVHEEKSLVARITETWMINLLPQAAVESRILTPLKWQVAGTIFAFHLAMQHGWSINLGGGFHQSSAHDGNTFCLFSDILLAMKYVWRKHPLQKYLIIDLDAHQATGVERDLCELSPKKRKQVFMLDVFNDSINPPDSRADQGIDLRVALGRFTGDATYMKRLKKALEEAFAKFKPTLVIYVNGQDVLKSDQLGLLNLSDEAFFKRDELVFQMASDQRHCPIVMLLGGGYLTRGAKIQAESIRNLYAKNLIWGGHRSAGGSQRSLSRPRLGSPPKTEDSGHSGVGAGFKELKPQHREPSAKQQTASTLKHAHEADISHNAGRHQPAGAHKSAKGPGNGGGGGKAASKKGEGAAKKS